MKNIFSSVFILCIYSNCFSQYYDTSYFSAVNTYHGLSLINSNNDKSGNVYQVISRHNCQSCQDYSVLKIGSPSSWQYGLYFNSPANLKMSGDVNGNTFAFGTYYGYLYANDTMFHVGSDNSHYVLIKFDTTGNPSWAIVTTGTKIAVNDSGYCYVLNNDSLTLYSPDGIILWQRPGGGSQIFVDNNSNYYIKNPASLVKYKSDGNIKWQLTTNFNFERTYNNRCFLYDSSLIEELDPANGNIITSFPNFAGSLVFFDKNGSYYETKDSSLIKYNSLGMEWQTQLTGTSFANVGIDRHNNIYFANGYSSHLYDQYSHTTPVKLFVPPDLYMVPPALPITQFPFIAAYVGRINQQHSFNPKIETGDVKALCKESPTHIPFSVNKYHVSYTNGMRAELSDSTGNFADPLIIGYGTHSPIEAGVPFFNISGNHFKARIVANTPEIFGKPSKNIQQLVYPPRVSIVPNDYNNYSGVSCMPLTLSVQPAGPFIYKWYKKDYGMTGYYLYPYYNSNDSISVTTGYGDSYKVEVTDTTTECFTAPYYSNVYTSAAAHTIDFNLPDTVCLNAGPVDLFSNYLNGVFSGNNVFNYRFYPDSAGTGSHPVHLHINNAPSCYQTVDTTKYIYVDNCVNKIETMTVLPQKNGYCTGDTVTVNFSYDPASFNPGNKFIVQIGYYSSGSNSFQFTAVLDSGISSPVTGIIPDQYFNGNYRVRVVSTDPVYTGTLNYDGILKIGVPDDYFSLLTNQLSSNCGNLNSVITLTNANSTGAKFIWHISNSSIIDSVNWNSGTSILANKPGDYSLEFINQYSCVTFSDTIHIADSLSVPQFSVTTSSQYVCPNDSFLVTLITDSINMVSWSNNSGIFTPPDPYSFYSGYYLSNLNLKVTSPQGCYVNKNVGAQQANPSGVQIYSTGNQYSFCAGDSLKIYAGSGTYQYQWYKDNSVINSGGNNNFLYVHDSGSYKVQIINQYGCASFSNTLNISVKVRPGAAISASGLTTFCSGQSVELNAPVNNNRTYQWKKGGNDIAGATASNYTVSIGGVYKVTVTNTITGCSKTSVHGTVVTVNPLPNAVITPQGPTTFCAGGSVLLNANTGTGLTYQWKKGGTDIPAATSDNYTATVGGVYKVREVNTYGCAKLSTGVVVSVPCREEGELNEISGGISIFPNPATGKFTIQSANEKISQIIITNISGQTILKKNFINSLQQQAGSIEIDLTNQAKGIYLIQVITAKEVYNLKMIVE